MSLSLEDQKRIYQEKKRIYEAECALKCEQLARESAAAAKSDWVFAYPTGEGVRPELDGTSGVP